MRKTNSKLKTILFASIIMLTLAACREREDVVVCAQPDIYPDYTDIVIPYNIAPLNFMLRDNSAHIEVKIEGDNGILKVSGRQKVDFPIRKFKRLLHDHIGDTLLVSVKTRQTGKWQLYEPFYWYVAPEAIDAYLTYRLIEPAYEVWNKINISQRHIESFNVRVLADNNLVKGACMNCHISNVHKERMSFFHLRHPTGGGTIINVNGELRKIDTRTDSTLSNGVYGNWHPSGRYIAFSTNVIIPEFHSRPDKRMLVYDTSSDIIILDLIRNEIVTSPLISRPDRLETFPEFSADGQTLYFCVANNVELPENYTQLKYSLLSIPFDPETRLFGHKTDTLFCSETQNKTVSQPRVSPNGNYLMFTSFDYGTFPIWHTDARLYLVNLSNNQITDLPEINNNLNYSNSHHSWSSNSRWFVFASKRDNGMFGKPYFSYLNDQGIASKPFVLPQKDPEFYDYFNKSFNIPELFKYDNRFHSGDIEKLFHLPAEKVQFVSDQSLDQNLKE